MVITIKRRNNNKFINIKNNLLLLKMVQKKNIMSEIMKNLIRISKFFFFFFVFYFLFFIFFIFFYFFLFFYFFIFYFFILFYFFVDH